MTIPNSLTEFVFAPNLTIVPGLTYFIGFDTGVVTSTIGGALGLEVRTDNPYPQGQYFENLDGGGLNPETLFDIASRIVMGSGQTAVPEPETFALLGLGLLGMSFGRRAVKTA